MPQANIEVFHSSGPGYSTDLVDGFIVSVDSLEMAFERAIAHETYISDEHSAEMVQVACTRISAHSGALVFYEQGAVCPETGRVTSLDSFYIYTIEIEF